MDNLCAKKMNFMEGRKIIMENIFIHDEIPTWSGFIYQGEIAIYLAVKKFVN